MGQDGYAPGEFRTLHGIASIPRGRVSCHRNNNRIQLFDQEANTCRHGRSSARRAGSPSTDKDQIYVADSESDGVNNPGGSRHQDRRS